MVKIQRIDVARGIKWVEVPDAGLRILCGCPADATKHLIKRGLIVEREINGVTSETGPNAILLSDVALQNGDFANLAEFPVLQMLYKQGLLLPGHPANTGRKPLLIGSAEQVDAQMRYIYRGNYGLVSREEMIEAGATDEQADALMRLKLAFAFGRIRPTEDFLDGRVLADGPLEIAEGVILRRLKPNVFQFSYCGETVVVDLNLKPDETYECPYPLAYHRYVPEYFSIIHSGEGDGWDVNRPGMSSIVTFQGRVYLIDAGPQISHVMTALGISVDQVDGIFHTHAHDDHFAGISALMRAGRRVRYYATPLVRAATARKLAALLSVEEDAFADFFAIHDLTVDEWNDIEGLEVMPVFSPHPIETNIFRFRTLSGHGYRSYAHFADIVSMHVLKGMVTDRADQPGLSPDDYERVHDAYLAPVDVKKIDVGGGLIHGAARDFCEDASWRILLAHRAGDLSAAEKEIGSSASFGTVDVLVADESESMRRYAFSYLEAQLPGVPLSHLRTLLNHPVTDVNPGAIVLKEGEMPSDVLLLLSGRVEKIRTKDGLLGSLPVGSLLGDQALLDRRPALHTYRACSFLRVMRLPPSLFIEILRRNHLEDHRRRATRLSGFLAATNIFGEGLPVTVLRRIVDGATEHTFEAGEDIGNEHLEVLNIIRAGKVERLSGARVVEVLAERDVFGEEAAIFNAPCLHGFRAVERTTAVQIPRSLIEAVPILRWKLMEFRQARAMRQLQEKSAGPRIAWTEEASVHVARTDRQHKMLFEIGDAIAENLAGPADPKVLTRIFGALGQYARYHFGSEEILMATYKYPELDAHHRAHLKLLETVDEYRNRIRSGDIPDGERFRNFFVDWLTRHIADDDARYGEFLNQRGVY